MNTLRWLKRKIKIFSTFHNSEALRFCLNMNFGCHHGEARIFWLILKLVYRLSRHNNNDTQLRMFRLSFMLVHSRRNLKGRPAQLSALESGSCKREISYSRVQDHQRMKNVRKSYYGIVCSAQTTTSFFLVDYCAALDKEPFQQQRQQCHSRGDGDDTLIAI